jgi:DNA-binding PadR family transcriptional regulator
LELIERTTKRTKGYINLHQGSVYPALRDLEKGGLATIRREVREEGGRPRLIYQITPEGQKIAKEDARAVLALFDFRVHR